MRNGFVMVHDASVVLKHTKILYVRQTIECLFAQSNHSIGDFKQLIIHCMVLIKPDQLRVRNLIWHSLLNKRSSWLQFSRWLHPKAVYL